MRNISAYPITKEEKLRALAQATRLLEKEQAGYIGGVDLIALDEVRKHIEALPEHDNWLARIKNTVRRRSSN